MSKVNELKSFKREIGQANHFLITIYIGLDGILSADIEKNEEFKVSWNPENKEKSVERSKLYAKKSSMAWLVNCIEMYIKQIKQAPSIIHDDKLIKTLNDNNTSRSVYNSLMELCKAIDIEIVELAMVDLLITWRNKSIHYEIENDIKLEHRKLLKNESDYIKSKFSNLDINRTLKSFDSNKYPSFKEVASLISSSIILVEEINNKLFQKLNIPEYTNQILIYYFKSYSNDDLQKQLDKIFSKDAMTKKKKLKEIIRNHSSFNLAEDPQISPLLNHISSLNVTQAKEALQKNTF